MIEVKTGTYSDLGADAHKVRDTVFCIEQGISMEIERDEADLSAVHAVVYENDIPVAAGRLIYDEENEIYLIGRISSLRAVRGKGYGKLIVKSLIEYAENNEIDEIHLHSQKHAEGFYKNLGFEAYGDVFLEAGIEHVSMMTKCRSRTGRLMFDTRM